MPKQTVKDMLQQFVIPKPNNIDFNPKKLQKNKMSTSLQQLPSAEETDYLL